MTLMVEMLACRQKVLSQYSTGSDSLLVNLDTRRRAGWFLPLSSPLMRSTRW